MSFFSAGNTLHILTGRSSSFEVSKVGPEEESDIKLHRNSEGNYKFGLVRDRDIVQRPNSTNKKYQTEMYYSRELENETVLNIEDTLSGLRVSKMGNSQKETITKEDTKIYLDSDKISTDNWDVWLESRHLYMREGPILLSDDEVRCGKTVTELRKELKDLLEKKIIRLLLNVDVLLFCSISLTEGFEIRKNK